MKAVFMPELLWPCWAYAINRVGGRASILTPHWLYEVMPKYLIPYSGLDPVCEPGPIIVWKNEDTKPEWAPVSIEESGRIVWKKMRYDYHAAAYEGNGFISDFCPPPGNILPFEIKIRSLSDLSKPDFYLDLHSIK